MPRKRAVTGYNVFAREAWKGGERPPVSTPKDMMRSIGELWRSLPQEEKEAYSAKAKAENDAMGQGQGGAVPAAAARPKRSPGVYAIFSKSVFATTEGSSFAEKARAIGIRWRSMTPEEKQPYYDLVAPPHPAVESPAKEL